MVASIGSTPSSVFRVSEQDRRACELNQRGVRSRAHRHGVLVRQEYWVHEFQNWVRERLKRIGPPAELTPRLSIAMVMTVKFCSASSA